MKIQLVSRYGVVLENLLIRGYLLLLIIYLFITFNLEGDWFIDRYDRI